MKKISILSIVFTLCLTLTALGASRGDRGGDVASIQQMLITQGYLVDSADGVFGNNTEYAVKAFQKDKKLPVDGVVGSKTLQALKKNNEKFSSSNQASRNQRAVPVSRYGDRGSHVEDIQLRLANSGFSPGSVDGVFGAGTASALKRFQAHYGLPQTGVVDEATKAKLSKERGMPTNYKKVVDMHATAYTANDPGNTNYTARGNLLRRGLVSVDPSVIPLGTELYIEGYGYAVADDTGGAIVGNRIDLAMESYDEAIQFGRRNVRVYVL